MKLLIVKRFRRWRVVVVTLWATGSSG